MSFRDYTDKKRALFYSMIVLVIGGIIGLGYFFYSSEYNTVEGIIIEIDEYGDATLDKGVTVSFRGQYTYDNNEVYWKDNYDKLKGKHVVIHYRVTDEGFWKIEQFAPLIILSARSKVIKWIKLNGD